MIFIACAGYASEKNCVIAARRRNPITESQIGQRGAFRSLRPVRAVARLGICLLLLIGCLSLAVINGQPFFFYDSIGYVDGPDAAVGRLLGDRFRSEWTQKAAAPSDVAATSAPKAASSDRSDEANSQSQKTVLSGRSIYYGTLLYVGHLTSYFWLTVVIQSVIFIYLSYVLICGCLNLRFYTFAWITAATLVLTPVSFYIDFLMPDIFASYLIIGVAILAVFWDALKRSQRIFVSLIVLFSALSHITHILILVALTCVFFGLCFFSRNRQPLATFRLRTFVLIAIVLAGALGEILFYQGVRLATGNSPIRPPFLMGRLIDDGPGYRYLLNHCDKKPYIVCNYLDRLPTSQDDFIWSRDPKKGVFSTISDIPTMHRLSAEQARFAIDVLRAEPFGQLNISVRNALSELMRVGLDEFFLSRVELYDYEEGMPREYLEVFLKGRITSSDSALRLGERWFFVVYAVSICAFLLLCLVPFLPRVGSELSRVWPAQYRDMFTICVLGVAVNACICGVLSGIYDRYQTRVSWIMVFMMLLALERIFFNRLSSRS